MPLSANIKDREFDKFRNGSRVAVTIEDGLLSGVTYDKITASYPSNLIEIYTYSLTGVDQASIKITYTDGSKNSLSIAERL